MIALLDSDIFVYRVGYASEDATEDIALVRLEILVSNIIKTLEVTDFKSFLTSTDKSNFRFDIYPEYKANRKQPKPKHYLALRNHLINKLDAEVIEGMEADDALGEAQDSGSIIVTIDKDMDQVPGWHYNFVQERKYCISEIEAIRSFYWQLLVGDTSDNVKGCQGIGIKKATRILEGCQDETEMLDAVIDNYQRAHPLDWHDKLTLAGKLLWIRKANKPEWLGMPSKSLKTIDLDIPMELV